MHQVLDDAALALVRRVRFVPPPPTRTPMRFSALIQYQVDP
jgi:outer membrane biosynthesis protein TonB